MVLKNWLKIWDIQNLLPPKILKIFKVVFKDIK